jgi:very-short-patch-repair endonuclease
MVGRHVKALRRSMTDAERELWQALRARSIGVKFRRQAPLEPYVVDFVCFDPKIVVEVDGSQHAESATDKVRDRYFEERGYRVLRFWNNDVLKNLNSVLESVHAATSPSPGTPLRGAPPSPSTGRGLGKRTP